MQRNARRGAKKTEFMPAQINPREDPPDSVSQALAESPCSAHHAPSARQSSPPRSDRHAHPPAKPKPHLSPAAAASVPSACLAESSTAFSRRLHGYRSSAHQSSLPARLPSS